MIEGSPLTASLPATGPVETHATRRMIAAQVCGSQSDDGLTISSTGSMLLNVIRLVCP